jgi:serine/threonine protein kinase
MGINGIASPGDMPLKPSRPGALMSSSQRSMSYEVSGTSKRVSEEGIKMSTRPSHMSLTASAFASSSHPPNGRESNKENVMDARPPSLSSMGHQRRISANARRYSSRRSPSPTSTAVGEVAAQSSDTGNYRRISAENDKRQSLSISARSMMRKSSEEVGASYRRRPAEGSSNLSPRQDTHDKDNHLTDEGVAMPSSSQYITPGLSSAGRVLRSGQAPKHSSALWSVGRSMKRIDRLNGPEKPPQRIVASQEEEEEDDEEEEEQMQSHIESVEHLESRSRWRETAKARLEVQEEDEELHEALGTRADEDVPSSTLDRTPREGQNSGSDGSNRRSPLHVPLGADEDEEEDDYMQDHHRSTRGEHSAAVARRSYPAKEVEPSGLRGAMHGIFQAKLPPVPVSKRALAEGGGSHNLGLASRDMPSAVVCSDKELKFDFMAQVRQEAVRQVGKEHLERLGNKPSKDLETKFNGYKFKKIRKAGEGGFSTVWQVRGPFAAPDPLQPGQYIDVPESEQAYFAMKQVTLKKMEKISREEVLEECNLLQSLAGKLNNEDFILRFFGWKSSTGSLKILLELGEHDFNHILREARLSRQQIVQYWHQMLEAVHFTHEEGGIVHTDLKPANFLMANGRLKLIDFGIAQKIPVGTIHIKRDAMIGTPNYMAPETVKAVKEASKKEGPIRNARVYKAGKASDVWALGCIFYQMVYNRPPFEAFHSDDKLKAILDPKHIIEYPSYRPAPHPEGGDQDGNDDAHDNTGSEEREMEEVDDDMISVMHLTFIYDAQERVTIPQLLDHAFLRPVQSKTPSERDNEVITISRATLKKMVARLFEFSTTGELHDGNLIDKSDALFDNIRNTQAMSR